MTDAIDFYLQVFKEISSIYEDDRSEEINISKELSKLVERLHDKHDPKVVESAITYVLSIFENYYADDYNRIKSETIPEDQRHIIKGTLTSEILQDEFNEALDKISNEDKKIILDILKKELS